jgi:protein gp37
MGESTGISWADRTKSAWHGCTHAILDDGTQHPGCAACYAELGAGRNPGTLGVWGPEGTRVPSKSFEKDCRQWQKQAASEGTIFTVFPSIHDPFEDRQGLEGQRKEMFGVIDDCPDLLFLLLTKRPGNIRKMTPVKGPQLFCGENANSIVGLDRAYRHNVALGTSISDQKTANELVMKLVQCGELTPLLFVSAEPLLGPIDLTRIPNGVGETYNALTAEVTIRRRGEEPHSFKTSDTKPIGWVIVGGESTAKARPCHPDWVRSLRNQSQRCGVAFHFKQFGEWLPISQIDGTEFDDFNGQSISLRHDGAVFDRYEPHTFCCSNCKIEECLKVGKAKAGNLLDGIRYEEFPQLILNRKSNV